MARPLWKRYAKLALKTGLAVVVLVAVGRHVATTWRDFRGKGESLHVEFAWIGAGGVLYLVGLSAFGAFFAQVMKASPTPIATLPSVRAYLISHLGKYVPGKAMVVIVRVGLATPYGARAATAALATFYETLVMMAGGALIAAAGFALGPSPPQIVAIAVSIGLAVAFLAVVEPHLFPKVFRLATLPFPNVGADALPRLSYPLLGAGLLWSLLGWTLLGLSQVAVVRAVAPAGLAVGLWPLVVASVALATVAGFVVAVLPGGLGVREGVLITTLAPALGHDTAVVAALALRLTWVGVEVLGAAALAPLGMTRAPAASAGQVES